MLSTLPLHVYLTNTLAHFCSCYRDGRWITAVNDSSVAQDKKGTNLRGGVGKEAVWNQVLWSLSQNCGLSSLEQLETPGELSVDSFLSA